MGGVIFATGPVAGLEYHFLLFWTHTPVLSCKLLSLDFPTCILQVSLNLLVLRPLTSHREQLTSRRTSGSEIIPTAGLHSSWHICPPEPETLTKLPGYPYVSLNSFEGHLNPNCSINQLPEITENKNASWGVGWRWSRLWLNQRTFAEPGAKPVSVPPVSKQPSAFPILPCSWRGPCA